MQSEDTLKIKEGDNFSSEEYLKEEHISIEENIPVENYLNENEINRKKNTEPTGDSEAAEANQLTEKDGVLIDFSELTKKAQNFIKKKRKEIKEENEKETTEEREEENDEEESIDFSDIKQKTKTFFKNFKGKKEYRQEDEKEENSLDFTKLTAFMKDNSKWLIPLILIIIAVSTSTYFRMMPSYLPATDDWATSNVYSYYENQYRNEINRQFPNLPEQNKNTLIEKEFKKFLEQNKDLIKNDIAQLSQQYKNQFQDENGDTYLLAIDPYLWYSQARNVIRHGHLGDKKIDGKSYFTLRDGRLDKYSSKQLHPYFAAYTYKILHLFDRDISIMRALFLVPAIIIGLALIPAFFIGRKISGNVGGFFAAMFLAVNAPLLGRTPAGFSDTDAYSILLPLLIVWIFLEACTAKKMYLKWLLVGLSGFFVGVYAATWSGWAYIFLSVLAIIPAALILVTVVELIRNKFKISFNSIKKSYLKKYFVVFIGFFVSSGIFVSSFTSTQKFLGAAARVIRFTTLKEVGIKTIWPNVLTTVAEFNTTPFSNIIGQMGGKFLFYISLLGVLLTLLIKNKDKKREFIYFCLLAIWFAGTAYSFTKGTRFAILMVPPFALALGSSLGYCYEKCSYWLSKGIKLKKRIKLDKRISKILIFTVLALLLTTPLSDAKRVAKNEFPSMNDAWYNTLTKIKLDSDDSIITSWWDFGHWFVAIAERRVTFDGGDQGQRIHWVGRTLRTDDETEAIGILRMLNCVQEKAPKKLDEFTGDSLRSVEMLYEIFQISDRNEAKKKYLELGLTPEQAEVMLEYTHCEDLLPNYYITSEDMVGKAGVWGHFGSWDFRKATMYYNTKKLPRAKAVSYLIENFDLTEEGANQLYNEIQSNKGDHWISPWPGYLSGRKGCEKLSENDIRCIGSIQGNNFALKIDTKSYAVSIEGNPEITPNSIVYLTKESIKEKKFTGQTAGFSVILIPNGEDYDFMLTDPLQAASTFTKLFFLNGHGMKCFSKFDDVRQTTGGRVITWKVDYDCKQENNVYFN